MADGAGLATSFTNKPANLCICAPITLAYPKQWSVNSNCGWRSAQQS